MSSCLPAAPRRGDADAPLHLAVDLLADGLGVGAGDDPAVTRTALRIAAKNLPDLDVEVVARALAGDAARRRRRGRRTGARRRDRLARDPWSARRRLRGSAMGRPRRRWICIGRLAVGLAATPTLWLLAMRPDEARAVRLRAAALDLATIALAPLVAADATALVDAVSGDRDADARRARAHRDPRRRQSVATDPRRAPRRRRRDRDRATRPPRSSAGATPSAGASPCSSPTSPASPACPEQLPARRGVSRRERLPAGPARGRGRARRLGRQVPRRLHPRRFRRADRARGRAARRRERRDRDAAARPRVQRDGAVAVAARHPRRHQHRA